MLKSLKHRPSVVDYCDGWKVVFSLVERLEVDSVLVYGLEANKRVAFKDAAAELGIQSRSLASDVKIGRFKPRLMEVEVNGRTVRFLFIRHPSSYFSWRLWGPFLQQHIQVQKQSDI